MGQLVIVGAVVEADLAEVPCYPSPLTPNPSPPP